MFSRFFRKPALPEVSRTFEGDVICDDTRDTVDRARLTVWTGKSEGGRLCETNGEADERGHFRLTPPAGNMFFVTAYPSTQASYLAFERQFVLADDAPTPKVEIALRRGIVVRGTIVELPSGRSVPGASVQYMPGCCLLDGTVTGWRTAVTTDSDGAFRITVPPGRGALFVYGPSRRNMYMYPRPWSDVPSNQYIYQGVEARDFGEAICRGKRHYVHAWMPLNLEPDSEPSLPPIPLRRSAAVQARLVDTSGRAVGRAMMLSRLCVNDRNTEFNGAPDRVVGVRFDIYGLDCCDRVLVCFLEPRKQLGATVEIARTVEQDRPLVIQLNKCGRAIARFIDPDGRPLVKFRPPLSIVVTPGPGMFNNDWERRKNELAADEAPAANMYYLERYRPAPVTNRRGCCTFPTLIPGATYRLPILRPSGERDELDFTVQPGQTLQLPDITLKLD